MLQQSQSVAAQPFFDDIALGDSEDRHRGKADPFAGRGYPVKRSLVRTFLGDSNRDLVAIRHDVLDGDATIREGDPKALGHTPQPFDSAHRL